MSRKDTEEKEKEQPWIEVKRQKDKPKPSQESPKGGRGRPIKNMVPPKDKTIQLPPRWTRARTRQMEEEQRQAQQNEQMDAHIEELIKTSNITALIKTDQQKWDP